MHCEIYPVTGAVIDSQFGDTLANRFNISWVPCCKALDPKYVHAYEYRAVRQATRHIYRSCESPA